MKFETENLQWMFEQFNEDFGNKGNLNLLVGVDKMGWHKGTAGYDLVIFDVSDLDTHLVNDMELSMYCTEYGLNEEDFEIRRVAIVNMQD